MSKPRAYEMEMEYAAAHGDTEFVAVDPRLDFDLAMIQLGEVLGVPAPLVQKMPAHWSNAAGVLLEARGIMAENANKRRK